jgi:two-component system phosphate regulon sensor histidine kinase PhoR
MKSPTIRTVSFAIALMAGGIMVLSLFMFSRHGITIVGSILITAAVVILVYLITLGTLISIIMDRIKPIYKTIYSVDLSKKKFKEKVASYSIDAAKEEVALWVKKKEEQIEILTEMEQFRKDFIGNVSHELKTPIFNIQGYILTLLDGAINDPEISKKYLERTEISINRLINILEDLDAITRLESGQEKLNLESFNIVRLVDETLESLEMEAQKKNIKLKRASVSNDSIMVEADRQKISQVLTNLVVNSIRYGNENGATAISFSSIPERVLIEVKDNGIGIEEKEIPRIFERFYRIDKHRSRESGGSGLGLSIVKHIVEIHNQGINVISKPGEGAIFAFTLKKAPQKKFLLANAQRNRAEVSDKE